MRALHAVPNALGFVVLGKLTALHAAWTVASLAQLNAIPVFHTLLKSAANVLACLFAPSQRGSSRPHLE